MGMAVIWVMWSKPFEQTFVSPSHGGFTWNLASIDPAVSNEKNFENAERVTLDKGQWMTLTFDINTDSFTYSVNLNYQLWYHRLQ